jgi:RHS repeat-associated protein
LRFENEDDDEDDFRREKSAGVGSLLSRFKYVASIGHPTDEETGLIYMRARYYEPGTGGVVSEDPGQDGSNWYAYVELNFCVLSIGAKLFPSPAVYPPRCAP